MAILQEKPDCQLYYYQIISQVLHHSTLFSCSSIRWYPHYYTERGSFQRKQLRNSLTVVITSGVVLLWLTKANSNLERAIS